MTNEVKLNLKTVHATIDTKERAVEDVCNERKPEPSFDHLTPEQKIQNTIQEQTQVDSPLVISSQHQSSKP